jgi:hypothetical protein
MNKVFVFLLAFTCVLVGTNGLSSSTRKSSTGNQKPVSRLSFLKTSVVTAATVLTNSNQAYAKGVDPSLKGTKEDPAYQTCLSQCIYDCTKPKGDEQKSRGECIPECKKQCATTKEQLLIGTPIKKN